MVGRRRSSQRGPVVFVPGFMQRADAWEAVARPVGERYRSVCLDPEGATLEARLAEIRAAAGPGSVLVGYSMGGRLAIHALLREPARYGGLITVGAQAGIESADERARRRVADAELAAWIERSPSEAIVERWEAQPMFSTQAADLRESQRPGRVAQDPATLASLLRSAGQGAMLPVWDRLGEIRCPSLHIAGELDEPYVDAARRIAELVTDGRVGVVPHAGHAAHLERPDEVARLVLEFLDANVGERARR